MTRPKPFQFHLSTLFIAITLACTVFALISYWGYGGFVERALTALSLAAVFSPCVEFVYWWRENIEICRDPENADRNSTS